MLLVKKLVMMMRGCDICGMELVDGGWDHNRVLCCRDCSTKRKWLGLGLYGKTKKREE